MILDIKAEKYEQTKEPIMGLTNKKEHYVGFTYPKTTHQQIQERIVKIKNKAKVITIKEHYNCYLKINNKQELKIITEEDKEYQQQNFRYELKPTDKTISINTIKKIMRNKKIETINSKELHNKIKQEIKKYVYLKIEAEYDILTIYIMLTYKYLHFDFYPIIYLNGDAGTGKSQLGKIAVKLSLNSSATVSTTKSSFFRRIDRKRGLYFMDEKENLEEYEKELLNGCTYEGNIHTVTQKIDDEYIDTNFQIYTPVMIACINEIYGATRTRTIKIETIKPPKEKRKYQIIKLTEDQKEWQEIRDELVVWSLQTNKENQELMTTNEELEHILNNRGLDAWKLILNQSKKNNCYQKIKTYIQDVYNDQIEETTDNDINYKFYKFILQVANGWIQAKELYKEFIQQTKLTENQEKYFTITKMGLTLRKIGHLDSNNNKKRTQQGFEYLINKENVLKHLKNNYDYQEYEEEKISEEMI